MDLHDYLKVLRRRWRSIVVIAVVTTAVAGVLTAVQTPQYASTARLFVTTSQSDDGQLLQGGQFSAQRVKSYADLISSRELAQRVIEETGIEVTPAVLTAAVSAQVVLETVNLEVTVTGPDPRQAQLVAQAYAEQLTDLVRELETPAGQTQAPIKATIVDAASLPTSAVSPRPSRNLALGLVAGLLLGFALAVVRELLDTRVKSLDDVAELTDAPTLGTIVFDATTAKSPLLTQIASHSPRAEAFRVLRTNLQFIDVDSARKVFVVTSAVPGEGKTSTAVNLAISLAQGGSRTLLVEADLRRPMAAQRLGLDNAVGLTNVLVGRLALDDVVLVDDASGLHVVGAGPVPPNPAELLQSRAMEDLLARARDSYDVVVIDAPPLLPVTDAALLAAKSDGALVVLSHGQVTRDQVRLSIDRLAQVDAQLAGLVLNKVPAKSGSYGYGYGYGYGYAPQVPAQTEE
ncbi:polysaccharide biosynthesis tyrosine autokinase [Nocardioides nitrophenolicus]|uniref:polysaccharide biosynthesis tyrosine autokinase n=1 Tax=Nocardioides nitrophenolicus TaxID=60489 RepID=UPI001956428E|nr:polysaccharide biosynthesis tyrosine autokinase [Nocardioides nitrophenolicus]MBM7518705.1 receptor protein-tyrosine kinase [Nocardioides nitrophenolicus]